MTTALRAGGANANWRRWRSNRRAAPRPPNHEMRSASRIGIGAEFQVTKQSELGIEMQVDVADRPVALLGDDDLRLVGDPLESFLPLLVRTLPRLVRGVRIRLLT